MDAWMCGCVCVNIQNAETGFQTSNNRCITNQISSVIYLIGRPSVNVQVRLETEKKEIGKQITYWRAELWIQAREQDKKRVDQSKRSA